MNVQDMLRELVQLPFDQEVTIRVKSKDGRYLRPRTCSRVLIPRPIRQGDPFEVSFVAGEFVADEKETS